VPTGDSGINKRFDRILKSFADEAPELFLRLLGFIPKGVETSIQPLRPETAPAAVLPDYVAVLRTGTEEPVLFHAEFQYKFHLRLPRDMARYGGSLAWQYQTPVQSVLVLLRPEGVPVSIPEIGFYNIGPTHTSHRFKVVRLWEVDPRPVLETDNPKLLPWALLMKSTDAQVREIASLLANGGDEDSVARFLTLASVRYDRSLLNQMLGGGKMGLVRAILDGSSIVREEREQAAAEGRAEGKALGKAEEARKVLRLGLRVKFPDLESLPEIDRISSIEGLETLIESVFTSIDGSAIRNAIVAAASRPN
jgi:predicted transposase YdaD